MFERKEQLIEAADAFVALPGGLGTLDEILDAVTLRQLGYHAKPILLVDLGGYWRACQAVFDQFVTAGFADPAAARLHELVPDVPGVVEPAGGGRAQRAAPDREPLRPARSCAPCCTRRRNSATKSIGSIISGGKPPSRVASATTRRANGNSRRGHSISSSGCRLSRGMLAS